MNAGKRQLSILHEFLLNKNYLSYNYLCDKFLITEKTLRQDINTINDYYKSLSIEIKLKKGKGFYLICTESALGALKKQLFSQFSTMNELFDNNESRIIEIVNILFSSDNYVKIDYISQKTSINTRTISNLLKEVRDILHEYDIKLITKPHYGMKIVGDEILIRYFLTDFSLYYSSDDIFKNDKREDDEISKLCATFIKNYKIRINQMEFRKLVTIIIVSYRRAASNRSPKFTKEQYKLINEFVLFDEISPLINKVERYFNYGYPDDEKNFIKMFFMLYIDYSYSYNLENCPTVIKTKAKFHLGKVIQKFLDLGICKKSNSKLYFDSLYPTIIFATMCDIFNIIASNVNSELKSAVCNSPLSISIGNLAYYTLEESFNQKLGESICIDLGLSVYSCIRATTNIKKLNTLAIFTIANEASGESLKRRIMDRFGNIIKRIDILTTLDIFTKDLSIYNCILHFEKNNPSGLDKNIKLLYVNYYFTEDDVIEFYEKVSVPSRIYKSAFANLSKHDYIYDYDYKNFKELKKFIYSFCKDEQIHKQINDLKLTRRIIFNDTLNLVMFTTKTENRMSKIIKLKKSVVYHNVKFSLIFIHIVEIKGDQITMKTTEKIIRNLTCQPDTKEMLNDDPIDFYTFYIKMEKRYLLD